MGWGHLPQIHSFKLAEDETSAGQFVVRLGAETPLNELVEQSADLYLAIEVREPPDAAFTALDARQALGAAPFAISAKKAVAGEVFEAEGLNVSGDSDPTPQCPRRCEYRRNPRRPGFRRQHPARIWVGAYWRGGFTGLRLGMDSRGYQHDTHGVVKSRAWGAALVDDDPDLHRERWVLGAHLERSVRGAWQRSTGDKIAHTPPAPGHDRLHACLSSAMCTSRTSAVCAAWSWSANH